MPGESALPENRPPEDRRSAWIKGPSTGIHAGYGPGARAITRWHVIGANHWKHDAGSKLCFCDLQDRTVVRSVVAGTEIRPDIKSDIWLAVLDQPLPSSSEFGEGLANDFNLFRQ